MKAPQLEVADIARQHGAAYLARYGKVTVPQQWRVLTDIVACRTATLGGHLKQCDQCGHIKVFYDSCRNRHCPKCKAAARADWMEARAQDLLETVEYYHAVFTLPDKLGPLALQNKKVLYNLLFRSVAEILKTIARDPKHLDAEIGFLALLHTWGQKLHHHPHIHCVIPGGGISPDGQRWIPCRNGFFLPGRVLSCLFKKKFLFHLNESFEHGKLSFHGQLHPLWQTNGWKRFLGLLWKRDWVVYTKPLFGGAHQVVKYLARYTHRVAISNQRLVSLEHGNVRFRWKHYKHGNRQRTCTLDAVQFLRRFLLHVLPKDFMRIRYYGFLANRHRREKIALCRRLLGLGDKPSICLPEAGNEEANGPTENYRSILCHLCRKGHMMDVETIPRHPTALHNPASFLNYDTG